MARLWVNECGNALDVELSAGAGEVEGRGRGCNDDLRLQGGNQSVEETSPALRFADGRTISYRQSDPDCHGWPCRNGATLWSPSCPIKPAVQYQ